MQAEVSVAILGGGPAGSAAALALHRLGIADIAQVEAGRHDRERIGESIPPDIMLLLDRLGLRAAFLGEDHDPCYGSASCWGSDALGFNDFMFNANGHGWHLDRRRFDGFLSDQVAQAGIDMQFDTEFRGAERDADGFLLRLAGPDGPERVVRARFVVDATGKRGRFAAHQQAKRLLLDQLTAVAGFFDLSDRPQELRLTLLEATEIGWWYAARLPGRRLVAMLATDPDIIRQRDLTNTEAWQAALAETRHVAPTVGGCQPVGGTVRAWAAPSFRLDRPCGPGWLAVGDAAATYDPLSAQGIHKALADGINAAGLIARALAGDEAALAEHAAWVTDRFEVFRQGRNYFYGTETRWPQAPFWQRRRSRTELGST